MSELLTRSIAAGKVTIRKRANVTGEVVVMFQDATIPPIYINTSGPVVLTDHKGVTTHAIMRSNLRILLAKHRVEVL